MKFSGCSWHAHLDADIRLLPGMLRCDWHACLFQAATVALAFESVWLWSRSYQSRRHAFTAAARLASLPVDNDASPAASVGVLTRGGRGRSR